VVASIGRVSDDSGCSACAWRNFSVSPARGTIWTIARHAYAIDEWDRSGKRLSAIEVKNDAWFDRWDPSVITPRGQRLPINAVIQEIHADSTGLLWVMATAPDGEFRHGTNPPVSGPSFRPAGASRAYHDSLASGRSTWSTIVDVIDPGEMRVVASQRFRTRTMRMTSQGFLYSIRIVGGDFDVMDIWRPVITRK
jgi:hypothetical protein